MASLQRESVATQPEFRFSYSVWKGSTSTRLFGYGELGSHLPTNGLFR